MASSSSLYFAESDPSYYLSTFEQEHCTGYNCCDIKLDDMHAVMEHYETVHQIPYLGNTRRSVPRLPAVRHQPIVTPLLPVAPIFDFDSASSPASTAYSERAASLPHEDEDHFDKGLDTAPQTPTASPTHSPFNVTIVGTHDSADGFNFNPMYQIGSPIVGTHQAFANSNTSVPKLAPAYPIMGVPQPPLLSVARPVDTPRQAPAMPPFHPHSSVLAPGLDVDSAVHNAEVESEEPSFYQQRRLQPATAVYPLQYQVPRPQVMRQSSLHAIPTAVPALTPARSHSINLPSRESSYTPRPMHESTYQRPLVPSPSPASDVLQISSSARMQAVRIRNNGSVPFPQSSAASSTVASPSIAGTKRSFDEVDASDSEDEDAQGEDDDEDAEGELEQDVSPVMQALLNRPAVTISRDAKGQGKEKRSKTGRPKGTGRSSAQKDPKRKKLECPRPGCTKRYMNPNGLKYHLEKGTCTLEA